MRNLCSGFQVSSLAWRKSGHSRAIEAVREAGFSGVEILCEKGHFEYSSRAHLNEVESALGKWPDARVTLHAPYEGMDLGATDTEIWETSLSVMTKVVDTAHLLRASAIVIHARSKEHWNEWTSSNLAALERSISRTLPFIAKYDLKLAVENFPTGGFAAAEDDMLDLLEIFPPSAVGACIDVGHAFMAGTLLDYAHLVAPRTFVMHLHDNSKESDEHLPPGEGKIDWPALSEALKGRHFRGERVIEVTPKGTIDETIERIRAGISHTRLAEF